MLVELAHWYVVLAPQSQRGFPVDIVRNTNVLTYLLACADILVALFGQFSLLKAVVVITDCMLRSCFVKSATDQRFLPVRFKRITLESVSSPVLSVSHTLRSLCF